MNDLGDVDYRQLLGNRLDQFALFSLSHGNLGGDEGENDKA